MMYWIALPPSPIRANSAIPAVIASRPQPSTVRTPARPTSLPACEAQAKIVSAIGRNTRPVVSGDRASTCCRYSEPMYHIGNSAALNSSTITLTTRSGLVNAFGGTSGAAARFSITGKSVSRIVPTAIGTSACADPQPWLPAVTPP